MKYRGKGFHTLEELEEVIDDLLEEKYENRQNDENNKILLGKLSELIKEFYILFKEESKSKDSKLTKENIIKNLIKYIENFSRDNNFEL